MIPRIQNISFASNSRRKLHNAEKVARKTNQAFPMQSSSYAKYVMHFDKNKNVEPLRAGLLGKIFSMRNDVTRLDEKDSKRPKDEQVPFKNDLDKTKKHHIGNCEEKAIAALASLASSGYLNSKIVDLYYVGEIVDEEGNSVRSFCFPLDHIFVMTDMQKEDSLDAKKQIVVDPWLSFAKNPDDAKSAYHSVFFDKITKSRERVYDIIGHRLPLEILDGLNDGKYFLEFSMRISDRHVLDKDELEKLAEYTKNTYPELII